MQTFAMTRCRPSSRGTEVDATSQSLSQPIMQDLGSEASGLNRSGFIGFMGLDGQLELLSSRPGLGTGHYRVQVHARMYASCIPLHTHVKNHPCKLHEGSTPGFIGRPSSFKYAKLWL